MEVHWDEATRSLYCPKPRECSYALWFKQAVDAVASEYRRQLSLTVATEWRDVPANVREEIEAVVAGSAT